MVKQQFLLVLAFYKINLIPPVKTGFSSQYFHSYLMPQYYQKEMIIDRLT